MMDDLFFIFDCLDRWGLDEIETLACPTCGAGNEVEVFDPSEIQIETCQNCGSSYEINWRVIQGDS